LHAFQPQIQATGTTPTFPSLSNLGVSSEEFVFDSQELLDWDILGVCDNMLNAPRNSDITIL
jgi:hypothetical protein